MKIIQAIATEVRRCLEGEGSGHDWWHVWRVWQMARRIGRAEGGDLFVIEFAALVHELGDAKISGGKEQHEQVERLLISYGVAPHVRDRVMQVVRHMSFRDNIATRRALSLEGQIVQDADRLDAIGAIGIARTFAYGGYKHRMIWNPKQKPVLHASKKAYFANTSSTANHFYEKLLLLKDRMNTHMAKKIANDRHRFMKDYLQRFFKEWKGKV